MKRSAERNKETENHTYKKNLQLRDFINLQNADKIRFPANMMFQFTI